MSGIHEYFKRTFSEWIIEDFLNKCDIKQFDIKIDRYLKSLDIIADYVTGKRKERTNLFLNKYRKEDDRTDYQIARKWRNNHDPTGGSSFHLHNPTFTRNPLMGNSGSISEKNISTLYTSYRLKAWQMARESGLSIETDYREILTKNISVKPLEDLLSEGTLTANIISPVLRSFFHDASIHPTIWHNTASMSSKIHKLADLDPSRVKQPDMIGNNNKSKYEIMFASDICCESQEKYENEVQRLRNYINKKKENGNVPVEIINRLKATLRIPQFKKIVKRK
ncbi:24295_t:CDS:2 [Cetraspora pellucida]|uniref:24295_t:CDS:1 n=1 Tax=Cetraspora pellucida TaxID=1433469 RepID=A0A9N9N767_9GLOM|nr:24295_t:CDS:2 [Cetraspora pellucida]